MRRRTARAGFAARQTSTARNRRAACPHAQRATSSFAVRIASAAVGTRGRQSSASCRHARPGRWQTPVQSPSRRARTTPRAASAERERGGRCRPVRRNRKPSASACRNPLPTAMRVRTAR
jgi:hypothetical protein